MSLANLRAAARLAREASQGRRTIELVLTEEGLLVRGWTVVDPEFKRRASRDVPWPELSSPADLASNAVELVDRELSAMEGRA
ncbi:hypothetical protein [Sphingopyxis sp. 113P3]|uniref:hypothetical protein n=1 Tax=Sphingopyxis sp. (strain 113P3) TaxID=292913 RepID=UPI0006AD563C|nr:hypothetical protein [Sphingopyxis sp. 113P3]ALC12525.1 hypothetical protein LH20_11235 [Sphingopyxis sp. 113P3]